MDLNNRRTGKHTTKPRALGLLGHSEILILSLFVGCFYRKGPADECCHPTDHPQSCRNLIVLERFCSVFKLLWLYIVCRLGVFAIQLRQTSSIFCLHFSQRYVGPIYKWRRIDSQAAWRRLYRQPLSIRQDGYEQTDVFFAWQSIDIESHFTFWS